MPKIFDFDYPFYNSTGKQDFQKQFLLHYFFHEICATPGPRWKVMLRARLTEIMPKYQKLWESDQLTYDPLTNINYTLEGGDHAEESTDYTRDQDTTDTHDMGREESGGGASHEETSGTSHQTGNETTHQTQSGGGSEHGTTTSTTGNLKKYSDTPQSNIPWNDIAGLNYLTNVTQDSGTQNGQSDSNNNWNSLADDSTESEVDGNTTGKADANNNWDSKSNQSDNGSGTLDIKDNTDFEHTRNWDEHRTGMTGSVTYQELIQQWRDLQVEYNKEILHDLADCFFQIY